MISRREWLRLTAGVGAALAMKGCTPSEGGGVGEAAATGEAAAAPRTPTGPLLTRTVPSSGEQLPVVGLGGANTFSATAGEKDFAHSQQIEGRLSSTARVLSDHPDPSFRQKENTAF